MTVSPIPCYSWGSFRRKLYDSITEEDRMIARKNWSPEQKEIAKQWMRERLERFTDRVPGEIVE